MWANINKSTKKKNNSINLDDDTLESLIFNKANFEAYLKQLLLVNHYRVEVFVNKCGKWALDYKVLLFFYIKS